MITFFMIVVLASLTCNFILLNKRMDFQRYAILSDGTEKSNEYRRKSKKLFRIEMCLFSIVIFSSISVFTLSSKQEKTYDLYTQKLIIQNEDKVELLKEDGSTKEYRVNFPDFFIDFEIYENRRSGLMGYSLITEPKVVIRYLGLKNKAIHIDKNEIDGRVYKPFREKYLIIDN